MTDEKDKKIISIDYYLGHIAVCYETNALEIVLRKTSETESALFLMLPHNTRYMIGSPSKNELWTPEYLDELKKDILERKTGLCVNKYGEAIISNLKNLIYKPEED